MTVISDVLQFGKKTMIRSMTNKLLAAPKRLGTFVRDNRGSVSVEFAFIMPLLITLYLGTMEISEGIEINKKVGRAASTIGDLMTQEKQVTLATVKDILKIGKSQLQPYDRSVPSFTVVGIDIDTTGKATVAWSQKMTGDSYTTPLTKGAVYASLPAKIKIADTFVVEITSTLEYLPLTSWSIKKNKGSGPTSYAAVDMKETYYFRPRQDPKLACADCP